MYEHPHTIENGSGEKLVFLRVVQDQDGERIEVENLLHPNSGPPMHSHHLQEESLTVVEGRIGFQRLGEEPQYASVGETVTFGPGTPHRFWNAGEGDLRCQGYIRPPDNIEFFLTSIYESTKQNEGKGPDPFDAAFLITRYKSEFAMTEIPQFVQRFVFPVQVLIGKVLGKYEKYADAPAPRETTS